MRTAHTHMVCQKGLWTVVYDGPLNVGSHVKNSTTLVVELVLNACRTVSLPIRDKMNNSVLSF
jgi:hypothetical protein